MYYLTESNSITSDEKLDKKMGLCIIGKTIGYYNIYDTFETIDFIKKQSDNVFDLIEVGDLVKTGIGKIFDVRKPYIDEGLAIVPFNIIFLNEINIIAIYKPNSRGDYIKVWEVKDNE